MATIEIDTSRTPKRRRKPWSTAKIVALVLTCILILFLILGALLAWLVYSGVLASLIPIPSRDHVVTVLEVPGINATAVDHMIAADLQKKIQARSDVEFVETQSFSGRGILTVYTGFGQTFTNKSLSDLHRIVKEHDLKNSSNGLWSRPERMTNAVPAGIIIVDRSTSDPGNPVDYLRLLGALASTIEEMPKVSATESHSTSLDVVIRPIDKLLAKSELSVYQIPSLIRAN